MTAGQVGSVAEADGERGGPRGSVLRRPGVLRVVTAELVSRFGSQLSALAIPWFVLAATGSTTRMGLVFAVEILPMAVLGIPAGQLVARLGPRRTAVAGDAACAALTLAVPLLHLAGFLPFWLLLLVVGLTGAVQAPYLAAQRLLLPQVLGDSEEAVVAANSLLESATWTARFAGPALAGVLLALMAPLTLLSFDAATFAASALLLARVRAPAAAKPAPDGRAPVAMAEGVRYALGDGTLRRLLLLVMALGLLMPFVLVSVPVLATQRYGGHPQAAGVLMAAWGGGAAIGTLLVLRFSRTVPAMRLVARGTAGVAVPMWLLAPHQPVATLALVLLACSMFIPMVSSPAMATVSVLPPERLRPQVMAVFVTAATVVGPLAYATAGVLYDRIGLAPVQLGVAAGLTCCAALLIGVGRP